MTLPPIGSNALFLRLLSIFQTTIPFLDPVIAQSILLCLISGNNHLILRSPEQDLALVVKIATLALSSLFNYQTHKIKLRHPSTDSTDHFLKSLFFKYKDTARLAPRSVTNGKHRHLVRRLSNDLGLDLDPTSRPHTPDTVQHLPHAVVVSGLEHAGTPAQRALVQVLREKRVILDGTPSAADNGLDGVWNLPDGFIMVYVCPWDPRERPAIHKSLLDTFAMSATVTLHPSTRLALQSSSLSFTNSSGSNLRPPTSPSSPISSPGTPPIFIPTLLHTLRTYHKHVYIAPALSIYTSDLFSAARHHPQLDGTLLSSLARASADTLIAAARVLGLGGDVTVPLVNDAESETSEAEAAHGWPGFGPDEQEVRVLDVSEADVARIVPRVISHRVRVRDGPEDEVLASAVFGAVGGRGWVEPERQWERSTVKDILVQILADV